MAHKIIIDADPGIGDALALAVALLDPDVEVVGLTAVAGMVSGVQATRNAQAMVELLDPQRHPRTGCSDELEPAGDVEFGARSISHGALNGARGLGDYEPPIVDLHNRRDAARVIVDLVHDDPNEITLVALGPLTNVAMAFELAHDLPGLLNGLVCFGGAVESGGNVTAAAEFNIWAAPEAARKVLRSPASKRLVPLDVSSRPIVAPEQLPSHVAESGSTAARAVAGMLQFSLRAHCQYFGVEGIRIDEVTALAALTRPELFESRPMAIDVETAGELTRGMTVFDRRGVQQWQTNIDVLTRVDYRGVVDYFLDTISRL